MFIFIFAISATMISEWNVWLRLNWQHYFPTLSLWQPTWNPKWQAINQVCFFFFIFLIKYYVFKDSDFKKDKSTKILNFFLKFTKWNLLFEIKTFLKYTFLFWFLRKFGFWPLKCTLPTMAAFNNNSIMINWIIC